MSKPEEDEVFFAYIVVAPHAVSLVLIRLNDGVQRPVYYVSKSLPKVKVRYLPLENVILAVVHVTRKLPHYFQAHTVVVLTQLHLQSLIHKADYTGRIAKWSIILGPSISRSEVGLVMISPKGIVIEKSLRLSFSATNNEAEYEALLVGMTIVPKMEGKVLEVFSDSRLVVGQVEGELEARDLRMQEFLS
ncbi:uncharacterized protein LOC142634835 [Castanea sativa]|uniref:uncharacterized protein LOC142634835 n=1 Tax=Castanea sativa TaxID=21020 RepID=UPI003F653CAE